VINGVLNVKNTKNHCLAYVRYINNINLQNLKKASLFVDILNRSLDTEACKLLADLRDERLPAKIESTNLQRWGAGSGGHRLLQQLGHLTNQPTPSVAYELHTLCSSRKMRVFT
jgi:hypothetical protein